MPIKTLIFDVGGVLVWTRWEKFAGPVSRLAGLTPEQVMEKIRVGDAYYPFMRGELDAHEFHLRMMCEFGLKLEADVFFDMWSSVIEPNHDIAPLVEKLAGRYRLSIGSNTDALHWRRGIQVQGIHRRFESPILSFEIGCCKPDIEFFEKGLRLLSAAPQECVFMDDREENVEAARSAGIHAIRFLSRQQAEAELRTLGVL